MKHKDIRLVRRVKKESAQAEVLRKLRDAILSGKLQPGQSVPELHLAQHYKVSQTTVREALVKLEHAGLVRRIPNVGTLITQMSPREIREHLRLRVMLEGLAGMEAARLMEPEHYVELDRRLNFISEAMAGADYFQIAQADLEFHRYIWERSGDKTLCRILQELTVPLFAFVSMERQRHSSSLRSTVRPHEPIAQALKERDSEAVREAIRVHIESSYNEFLGSGTEERYVLSVGQGT